MSFANDMANNFASCEQGYLRLVRQLRNGVSKAHISLCVAGRRDFIGSGSCQTSPLQG